MIIRVRVDALLSARFVEKKKSGANENALEGGVGRALVRQIIIRPSVRNWQLQRFEAFHAPRPQRRKPFDIQKLWHCLGVRQIMQGLRVALHLSR